jgi:hypothetical protein
MGYCGFTIRMMRAQLVESLPNDGKLVVLIGLALAGANPLVGYDPGILGRVECSLGRGTTLGHLPCQFHLAEPTDLLFEID